MFVCQLIKWTRGTPSCSNWSMSRRRRWPPTRTWTPASPPSPPVSSCSPSWRSSAITYTSSRFDNHSTLPIPKLESKLVLFYSFIRGSKYSVMELLLLGRRPRRKKQAPEVSYELKPRNLIITSKCFRGWDCHGWRKCELSEARERIDIKCECAKVFFHF